MPQIITLFHYLYTLVCVGLPHPDFFFFLTHIHGIFHPKVDKVIKAGPLTTNVPKIQIPEGWKWFVFKDVICF